MQTWLCCVPGQSKCSQSSLALEMFWRRTREGTGGTSVELDSGLVQDIEAMRLKKVENLFWESEHKKPQCQDQWGKIGLWFTPPLAKGIFNLSVAIHVTISREQFENTRPSKNTAHRPQLEELTQHSGSLQGIFINLGCVRDKYLCLCAAFSGKPFFSWLLYWIYSVLVPSLTV